MAPRRIELSEAVTIKPLLVEKDGKFTPVPGKFAYYRPDGSPLRQDGKTLEVQAEDVLVVPANSRISTLDLHFKNTDGKNLPPSIPMPSVTVENHGKPLTISGSSGKLILAGGDFKVESTQAGLANLKLSQGRVDAEPRLVEIKSKIDPKENAGYSIGGSAGNITVMKGTRVDVVDRNTNGRPLLTVDADEKPAIIRARIADMEQTAKEKVKTIFNSRDPAAGLTEIGLTPTGPVRGGNMAVSKTTNLNPEYSAIAPAADPKKVPDGAAPIKLDAPGAAPAMPPAGKQADPAPAVPGRPPNPAVPPKAMELTAATVAVLNDAEKELGSILSPRGNGKGQDPNGRAGFFAQLPDLKVTLELIKDTAADLAKNKKADPEKIKLMNQKLEDSIQYMEKSVKGVPPQVKPIAEEIKNRLEKIREKTKGSTQLGMAEALSGMNLSALAMLIDGNSPALTAAPTLATAVSPEAAAMLNSVSGTTSGRPSDIPTPQSNGRAIT